MGEGSYITLFSPSDVTAFHRMKYGEGCYITLFSPSDVTAFHRKLFSDVTWIARDVKFSLFNIKTALVYCLV